MKEEKKIVITLNPNRVPVFTRPTFVHFPIFMTATTATWNTSRVGGPIDDENRKKKRREKKHKYIISHCKSFMLKCKFHWTPVWIINSTINLNSFTCQNGWPRIQYAPRDNWRVHNKHTIEPIVYGTNSNRNIWINVRIRRNTHCWPRAELLMRKMMFEITSLLCLTSQCHF